MMRTLHRWPGLVLALLLCVTAFSGATLALFPVLEAVQTPAPPQGLTVAELAARIQAHHPGLEEIQRSPSGQIRAWWFEGDQPGSAMIDPSTGMDSGSADPNASQRWLTSLHRSLFLGDGGRLLTAAGAAAMLLLAISGAWLVARRTGGWRRWFSRLNGPWAGRLHTETARIAVLGLGLSALTALWMSAETFELIAVDASAVRAPGSVSGQCCMALQQMPALQNTPVAALRALNFPAPDDPQDMYTLRTQQGSGYIDAGTGRLLTWQPLSGMQRLSETVAMLHTGQGAPLIGLWLGLTALSVPVLAITGLLVWLAGYRARPRLRNNTAAQRAQTVVLVGSESGTTWGFAATLAAALRGAGHTVHIAPMQGFAPARYPMAQRFLILTATYGEGGAPASAASFLAQLQVLPAAPAAPFAVLGFGDRSFPGYCAFAAAVDHAARAQGWSALLPLDTVNRQSPQDFARWGRALGQVLGLELTLTHQPSAPATQTLTLLSRRDYGAAVQVPMSILRFALPATSCWQRLCGQGWRHFEPGDLLGIVPEGATVARMYSLASAAQDGYLEIVVRAHPGGLASTQLTQLQPGQQVQAFLQRHPGFHADAAATPLILIGAGTGVGPLAGFIRRNLSHRPIHLFFGLRHPDSDLLYADELRHWQSTGQLTQLHLACSRTEHPQYVQDVLRQAAPQITAAMQQGGKIMVCGGRAMAQGVADALSDILQPAGFTLAALKDSQRYVEDIY